MDGGDTRISEFYLLVCLTIIHNLHGIYLLCMTFFSRGV